MLFSRAKSSQSECGHLFCISFLLYFGLLAGEQKKQIQFYLDQ